MSYFPFYTNISNKTFLIIGGGTVALEKVDRLRRFTDSIIVIAPHTRTGCRSCGANTGKRISLWVTM